MNKPAKPDEKRRDKPTRYNRKAVTYARNQKQTRNIHEQISRHANKNHTQTKEIRKSENTPKLEARHETNTDMTQHHTRSTTIHDPSPYTIEHKRKPKENKIQTTNYKARLAGGEGAQSLQLAASRYAGVKDPKADNETALD